MNSTTEEKQPATITPNSLPKTSTESINHPPKSGIASETTLEMEDGHNKVTDMNTATNVEKDSKKRTFQRGPRFWGIMVALSVTAILSALEGTVVSTALPTIIRDLGGGELYLWAPNGYFLPNMAFQPLYAQAADIFGRRWVYIFAVMVFTIGSAISGSAVNMSMFISGRVLQGTGGAGLAIMGNLIICDLVPLRDRGAYLALIYCAITVGNGIGPFIGGIIVQSTTWRWVFYMNLPLAGVSLVLLLTFLKVGYHKEPVVQKLKRIDYLGEAIFIGSVVAITVSLTYAGVKHPWSAWQTILPLVLGFAGLGVFLAYEGSRFCLEPTIPPRLFTNKTTVAACILALINSLLMVWVMYFLPVYFQAVLGSSPARSGVQLLPTILIIIPFAAVSGKIVQKFGRYRPLAIIGSAIAVIGLGLFTLLNEHSSVAAWVLFQVIEGAGCGLVISTLLPAAQAALDEVDTAKVIGAASFIRSFGISLSVTIPGALFNSRFNSLAYRISDASVRAVLVDGQAYEHATKAFIGSFQNPLRDEIVGVYTDSLKFTWEVAIGIAGLGFLVGFLMKEIELRKTLETDYGMTKKDANKEGS